MLREIQATTGELVSGEASILGAPPKLTE